MIPPSPIPFYSIPAGLIWNNIMITPNVKEDKGSTVMGGGVMVSGGGKRGVMVPRGGDMVWLVGKE